MSSREEVTPRMRAVTLARRLDPAVLSSETPFLIHAALRLAPWRLALLPFVLLTMIAYGVRLIDRARLKEIGSE